MVMPGQVGAHQGIGLIGSGTVGRAHVTGLAAEIARRTVLVIAAPACRQCRLVGDFKRTTGQLQIGRETVELRNARRRQGARFIFTEGALYDPIGVNRIIECRLFLNGSTRIGFSAMGILAGPDRRCPGLRAVTGRQVTGHRIGNIMA